MSKYEKPQKRNPNRLTIKQHVFPLKSIARFGDASGTVSLFDFSQKTVRPAKPNDDVFCAKRAWSQQAESGYMKKVEDAFQPLVASILVGDIVEIRGADVVTASDFYALWYMRSRHRELGSQEIALKGVVGGGGLTKDQEEKLEMNGYVFSRDGGKIPARHINGVQLQVSIFKFSRQIQASTQWGILQTNDGEFIVPDVPSHEIMPLSPQVALATRTVGGMITVDTLVNINRALCSASEKYFFARHFPNCPR